MYCAKCGQPLADGAQFCGKCGSPVGAIASVAGAAPAAETAIGAPIHAGFWRRGAAYLVDSLVLLVPNVVLGVALGGNGHAATLAQLAMWWLYKALMESGPRQATVGKMALGIKVTDVHGRRISFGRASGRFFASLLSALLVGIGYLMAAFTRRKQALHDLIAGCLVVRATATEAEIPEGSGTMPLTPGVWAGIVVFLFFPLLGILAAIAIPAYQDYIVRAKMAEAIFETAELRPGAAQEIAAYARDPQAAGGIVSHSVTPKSKYITRIVIDKPARAIDVQLDGAKLGGMMDREEPRVRWTLADDGTTWTCRAAHVPPKYLPVACRG